MPGLILEAEEKILEDESIVEGDDTEDSDEDNHTEDSDDGAQESTIRELLAEVKREFADIKMMMADNFNQILLMLEALPNKVYEILAQTLADPSLSHEPVPIHTSTTVDTVGSNPDSNSSSPAPAVDTPDTAPAFLVPEITAAVIAIPPIETGDTNMPDAAS